MLYYLSNLIVDDGETIRRKHRRARKGSNYSFVKKFDGGDGPLLLLLYQ